VGIGKSLNLLLSRWNVRLVRGPLPRTTTDLIRGTTLPHDAARVVDVGAAKGDFCAEVLRFRPRAEVICLEPIEAQAALLRNRFGPGRVHVVRAAAGERDGELTFHEVRNLDSSSVLPMDRHRREFPSISAETGTYPVQVRCLDSIVEDSWPERDIDLLKIDVQGYELPVLRGASRTLRRSRFVIVEVSLCVLYHGQAPFEELLLTMYEAGFRVVDYVEGARSAVSGELLQMDFLYQKREGV
jgi:FkbM family methyltransferase